LWFLVIELILLIALIVTFILVKTSGSEQPEKPKETPPSIPAGPAVPEDDPTASVLPDWQTKPSNLKAFVPKSTDSTEFAENLASEYGILVSLSDNTVLQDFKNGFIKNANPALRTRFYLQIMLQTAGRYLQYLKQIDKITDFIEKRLYKATTNNELVQLLDLQKSLVYISTALKNIEMTLSKIERGRILKLYSDDAELFEDVVIEFRQAREMADTFASVLAGTIETFSSVISNNLNETMKKLTSVTILLAIPTMISGFYGMNIGTAGIPLAWNFWLPVAVSAVITIGAAFVLIKKKML
jgi:magnesium transporter